MIISFLGNDYIRSLAEFYMVNLYGFRKFDPRESLLEGTKKIFKLTDLQLYSEAFYEDEINLFEKQTPQDLFKEVEDCILYSHPNYYELVTSKYVEDVEGNILIVGLSCNTNLFERDDFFVIGLNCDGDLIISFKDEMEIFSWLDDFLKGKGIEKGLGGDVWV